jgi:hypothetical protein
VTKKHFEAAARQIREADLTREEKYVVADNFATLFQAFNPLFDTVRFYTAAGLR